jgi:hypothetical protein
VIGMGVIFGIGSIVFALLFAVRLLPKLVGLSLWLASAAITGGAALTVLYLLDRAP